MRRLPRYAIRDTLRFQSIAAWERSATRSPQLARTWKTSHPFVAGQRAFISLHPALLPPVVFGGLLVTLWAWKCLMLVVFQNKIIYMPGLPPNARREKISDYSSQCGGIAWREEHVFTKDGKRIALAVADVAIPAARREAQEQSHIYVLYFQGS
jgi:hypothetical protein